MYLLILCAVTTDYGTSAVPKANTSSLAAARNASPKGSGIGSGGGSGDVYTWNPTDGTNLASHPQNWLLNSQSQGSNGTVPGNKSTDQVVFDGATSNAPIEWDTP
jgi:hypothetical protein